MSKNVKKRNLKRQVVVVFLACCLISVAIIALVQILNMRQSSSQAISHINDFKMYHSEILKIKINVQKNLEIDERFGEIYIYQDKEEIRIHRVGGNHIYSNIQEFLDDNFKSDSNKTVTVENKKLNIKSYNAAVVTITYQQIPEKNNKAYYIFVNNNIYHFYTNSSELYDELDQIAQSFRYQP